MITGNAINYFFTMLKDCNKYKEAIQGLRRWYSTNEKKERILTAWKSMTLTRTLADDPAFSEFTVFAKLMSLQRKFGPAIS